MSSLHVIPIIFPEFVTETLFFTLLIIIDMATFLVKTEKSKGFKIYFLFTDLTLRIYYKVLTINLQL